MFSPFLQIRFLSNVLSNKAAHNSPLQSSTAHRLEQGDFVVSVEIGGLHRAKPPQFITGGGLCPSAEGLSPPYVFLLSKALI